MTKTGLEFRILVIVICLIFVICDLEFLTLQCFSRLPQEEDKFCFIVFALSLAPFPLVVLKSPPVHST